MLVSVIAFFDNPRFVVPMAPPRCVLSRVQRRVLFARRWNAMADEILRQCRGLS